MINHLVEEPIKIRTAYGIGSPNEITYVERAQIVAKIMANLSIRGRNPMEFKEKLEELIKDYE